MTGILWFKRDLRVSDHAAAAAAAAAGPVVCLYIVEPDYWALPDTSGRQWAFIAECLDSLRAQLDVPLLVRVGDAVSVLETIRREVGATHLFSHEETGNLWTYGRDKAVARWAQNAGVGWTELPQSGVVRRLKGRDGWAARRERFVRNPTILPVKLKGPALEPGGIPTSRDLELEEDPCPGRQVGGREAAMTMLGGFL
ncbi:MAG: deoxyribodipyrimidine photo-lyase, partial [Pseudomonadota bacterium]